jgi:asparagine synthase (glutamine-hydrolysing)
MCAIYGWLAKRRAMGGRETFEAASRMSASMACRGPDFQACLALGGDGDWMDALDGTLRDSRLVLGHNRLSIIDLSSEANQPMRSADGRYTIVYNGEIYNYIELRSELESAGRSFRTRSDTEVLLAAFDAWGTECFVRFNGMFAFAIFDAKEKRLVCARDFFGIKPFFYSDEAEAFAFASEIPALLEFPGAGRNLNVRKAFDFLNYGGVDVGDETMVEGIRQLPPAHYMVVDAPTGMIAEAKRYWDIDPSRESQQASYKASAEALREGFIESVRVHLRSDVPLGIALSGGIDSSAVACAVRRIDRAAEIHTFSYVPEGEGARSEEKWIDIVNQTIGAVPHKVKIGDTDLVGEIDRLILRLGEPFRTTSIYAQHRVFKAARESGIIVTLEGQGADELLGGYDGYPADRVASLVAAGRLQEAAAYLGAASSWPGRSRKAIAKEVARRLIPEGFKRLAGLVFERRPPAPWLDRGFLRGRLASRGPIRGDRPGGKRRFAEALAYAATRQGLPGLLRHGDRNAMSWSIESRVPFCAAGFAEYALGLPEEYHVDSSGATKRIFRDAMRGIVPDAVLDRRDKIGFSTPEAAWLRAMASWVDDIVARCPSGGLLDPFDLRFRWGRFRDGTRGYDPGLWRCLNYIRWRELLRIEE